jgi:hypothetical protein
LAVTSARNINRKALTGEHFKTLTTWPFKFDEKDDFWDREQLGYAYSQIEKLRAIQINRRCYLSTFMAGKTTPATKPMMLRTSEAYFAA